MFLWSNRTWTSFLLVPNTSMSMLKMQFVVSEMVLYAKNATGSVNDFDVNLVE